MTDGPVNLWQQALYDLVFEHQLVNPKALAFRLHKASNYLSDICRRERVDPFAVFNELLKMLDAQVATNPALGCLLMEKLLVPIVQQTNWKLLHCPPPATHADPEQLCGNVSMLLTDLGGAIEALSKILADGQVTESDDPSIFEFQTKANRLSGLLGQMLIRITHLRRAEAAL